MTVRTILTEPNKLLRQISKPVKRVGKNEQILMDDMLETMYAAQGIGLAAIQIGFPKRIIVMDLGKDHANKKPMYFVNPVILNKAKGRTNYGAASAASRQSSIRAHARSRTRAPARLQTGKMDEGMLSPQHAEQLVEYLRFLRRKREQCVSEVAAEFKELRESRLFEDQHERSSDEWHARTGRCGLPQRSTCGDMTHH